MGSNGLQIMTDRNSKIMKKHNFVAVAGANIPMTETE